MPDSQFLILIDCLFKLENRSFQNTHVNGSRSLETKDNENNDDDLETGILLDITD
jgi:hypothetical protein